MIVSTVQPDGTYRVCLSENGITACTYVSSAHLCDEKERQLRNAITTQAQRAFDADN